MKKSINAIFPFCLLLASTASYALPFNVVPKAGTQLPTMVLAGSGAPAFYTVTNLTMAQRNGNFVKYLPPNVTQVTAGGTFADTCGATFNLAGSGQAGSSCTLQLMVSGTVNGNDSNPHNHLFVCFPAGTTCAGTNFPLNVTQGSQGLAGYVVNRAINSVALCPINGNGTLGTCNSTGPLFNDPNIIAINPADTFAYIGNFATNTFTYCAINNDGSFGACNPAGGPGFPTPEGIAFNPAGNFVYVTNTVAGAGVVSMCTINANGSFGTCGNATAEFLANPFGIAFNPTNTFAYVVNNANDSVSSCAVGVNGKLGVAGGGAPCGFNNSGSGLAAFVSPTNVVVDAAGLYAYVVSNGNSRVFQCPINPLNGTFGVCTSTGNGFSGPSGIALNPSNTFAYINNFGNNTVSACPINADGSFGTCTATGGFFGPDAIAVN